MPSSRPLKLFLFLALVYLGLVLTPQTAYLFKVGAGDSSNNWSANGPSLSVTTVSTPTTTYVGAYLEVQSYYLNTPHPGGNLTIDNNFTAVGTEPVIVTSLTTTSDLGNWTMQSGPFQLAAGQGRHVDITVTIPTSAYIGNHTVTVTVSWLGYNPSTGTWILANPLRFTGPVPVQSATRPNTPPQPNRIPGFQLLQSLFTVEGILVATGIAVALAISIVTIVLATRRQANTPATTMPGTYCPRCGQVNGPSARFCMNCGNSIPAI